MESDSPQNPPPKRMSLMASFGNKVFIGLILAAPILATIWFFNFLLGLTTSWFPRMFPQLGEKYNIYLLQFLVLLAVVLFFYLLGALTNYFVGKRLYGIIERIFMNIPIVRDIYKFVRQLCGWVARSRTNIFQSVVLIEYPRPGIRSMAFVTSDTSPDLCRGFTDEHGNQLPCKNIFLPTAPNPTSGFFLIVPERDITKLDIEVSDALNLIISAGAILPEAAKKQQGDGSLLDTIDSLANSASQNAAAKTK
ncbi:MAG: DUF502 domain-containing protein [Kiritimatiellae bacterium]|nr:DUF502 domain-containing protein [Kiritimatiellia bacterium]